MLLEQLKKNLLAACTLLIKSKKTWRAPKKSQILIYDANGLEALLPSIKKYSFEVLYRDGELINLYCLASATLTREFWTGRIFTAYASVYIKFVNPKVIITFIDNSKAFYLLSKRFSGSKTIFLQNGTRAPYGDVFDGLVRQDDYHVDYMLVHNRSIGRLYNQYITGKILPIGSLKNNTIGRAATLKKNVLFVSQWRPKPKDGVPFITLNPSIKIQWSDFYEDDVAVICFLDRWCAKYDVQLTVCGGHSALAEAEEAFYTKFLTQSNWEFVAKTSLLSSYQLIAEAGLVVFIDSTLGYEAIGRGKKTASFSCRMVPEHELKLFKFGWPANLTECGPFWTNTRDEIEFERVMAYIAMVSDDEWGSMCRSYTPELMEFDTGNTQFIALLEELLS